MGRPSAGGSHGPAGLGGLEAGEAGVQLGAGGGESRSRGVARSGRRSGCGGGDGTRQNGASASVLVSHGFLKAFEMQEVPLMCFIPDPKI